jgi:LPS-assembly protein
MKNKKIILFLLVFFPASLLADTLLIQSKNITLDKNKEFSIFKEDVFVKTKDDDTINSDYAEYNKKTSFLKFESNVKLIDRKRNIITASYAEYKEKEKIFKTIGETKIVTSENYIIKGEDIILDNKLKIIKSNKKATITDKEDNIINLDSFEYLVDSKIFKSIGFIEIKDIKNNSYKFSQIYIDTLKKEILGTDIKAFLNDSNFKINEKNKPRIFANAVNLNKTKTTFNKSIFTLCDYRKGKKGDKCPPWSIQASKMHHDSIDKTIYYDNAVIKVYNIPIFYIPKLSHPDPSIERRSGFLPATLTDTKNLGSGISIPYFLALDKDKDFTFTNKLYANENPLLMGEYRQAFKNSNLILDMGYTDGYKNTSRTKTSGDKSHLFSKYVKKFIGKNNSETSFSFQTQNISNDKYLKLYRIKSNLVDYNVDVLENSISFSHSNDDYFLSANTFLYETLKDDYNDKYEYIFPEIIFDKNLFSNKYYGNLDLQSNLKVNNFETNKTSKFLINDFNWNSKDFNYNSGIKGKLIGKVKNVNYDNKNIDLFKEETTNEIHGAIGYLAELDLIKGDKNSSSKSMISPKLLLRYAPGNIRKEKNENGTKLDPTSAFSINRMNDSDKLEKGTSLTLGFDYSLNDMDKEFNLSIGQIIKSEEDSKMASVTSLNDKLSDLVGTANLKVNEKISIGYNFNLDQNYNDFNYNEVLSTLNFNPIKVDFNYLQEKKHVGNNEYFKTKINYDTGSNTGLNFETKRNLITNSSEYYDMSYEYYNDCLRAALVFRREFYNDSELEPENSLMFKITLVPFGSIDTPDLN